LSLEIAETGLIPSLHAVPVPVLCCPASRSARRNARRGATPDLLTRTAATLEATEPRAIAMIAIFARVQFYRP
jgi:hypothetical protein